MKKLFTLLTLVLFLNVKAQFVAIPDSNFVHYLKTIVQPAFKGDSLDTTHVLVTTTTHSIICSNRSISYMTGVTYFKSLKYLDCRNNVTGTFYLPALPDSLTYLNCNYVCNMQTLPALPATLKYLDCHYSGTSFFPPLPDSLTYFDCSFDLLNSLPNLPNSLNTLICYENAFATLPPLPTSLGYLDCHHMTLFGNGLSSLPPLPASLVYLDCSQNKINSLPALPNSLTYLDCSDNSLNGLLTLPNSLNYLSCFNNQHLTSFSTFPNSLQYLNCVYDSISCFPTFPNSITSLSIDPNPYNCLPNYISAMGTDTVTYPKCSTGNTNGCAVALGISQISALNTQISIYPNPSNGNFVIETNAADKQTLQVYDVNGRLVLTQSVSGKASIDASHLPNGIYNVSLISNEGITNKRLVIAK